MPIRTHRGRAAVYRRIWGAPLKSPKHLIVTVVILVAFITAIGFLVPKIVPREDDTPMGLSGSSSTAPATGPGGGPATTSPTTSPSLTETRLTEAPVSPRTAAPDAAALKVAKKWAQAWVNHPKGVSSEEWIEGLAPYTTEEYLPVIESVDPANVPATKVTGEPKATASYTKSVEVQIPTDGPKLQISVVRTHEGWRVAQYQEAGS